MAMTSPLNYNKLKKSCYWVWCSEDWPLYICWKYMRKYDWNHSTFNIVAIGKAVLISKMSNNDHILMKKYV